MNKVYPSAAAALEGVVADGQLIAVGGFGLCGIPEALIDALRDSGVLAAGASVRLKPRRLRRFGQAGEVATDFAPSDPATAI